MSALGLKRRFDPGFGRELAWDIDLLGGYDHEFVDVHEGPSQDLFLWLRLKGSFGNTLRDQGVRALWVQGWQVAAYWQIIWEAQRMGVEVWLRGETNLRSNGDGAVQALKRVILRRLLGRVDRFLYIGEANRQFYLSQGIRPDQMIAAPYCVDNARFAAQASRLRLERRRLRKQWLIPDDAFCFLFVGKLIPKKRPDDLIAAVRGLHGNGIERPVHILFVGTGELADQLRQSCKTPGSGGSQTSFASFAGFLNQSEISLAYVAADCLVLPSDASETWGLVVNEAMASGLPCVTSDACGCVEDLILPIDSALSYPVGKVAGLQRCLERVMIDPPPRSRLERHINDYDLLRTIEAAEQLYAEAATRKAA